MSGIVGIVHFDGAPVDRDLLVEMTEFMAFRGPDGHRVSLEGPIGFGYAKLATTEEALREDQPYALDDDLWIVADARIDGRSELVGELESRGQHGIRRATDVELILHAYKVWGEDVAAHLLGDFSFAIWDRAKHRLFCARDHFGVRPFYYAEWPGGIAFSNTLGCLRKHPAVTSALNELAVADYLLFWWNMDPRATTFADIRRLPAAHRLRRSPQGSDVCRYWDFPVEEATESEPAEGWVERFRAVLSTAVDDRLRTDQVAVLMSGGLDSTSVAAVAQGLYSERGLGSGVHTFTVGYDHLISHEEGRYAEIVAKSLCVPFHYQPLDNYRLAERWGELPVPPEPGEHFRDALAFDHNRNVSANHRVVLTGEGGDAVLDHLSGYFLQQLKQLRLDNAVRYLVGTLRRTGRLPPLGLLTHWARWRGRNSWRDSYPKWLDPDLEARLDLKGRWRWYHLERGPRVLNPSHPGTHRSLWDVFWPNLFEREDGGARTSPIERRHPLMDLRLVKLLLKVPPVPWCVDKHLLREAMRGVLPEAVRNRAKSPLAKAPKHLLVEPLSEIWEQQIRRVPEIANYVRPRAVLDELRGRQASFTAILDSICQPVRFAYWFENAL